jgi:hypothetical protein
MNSDYYNNDSKTNTFSKVKRFGSMLIRGKKSARPDVHVFTSPRVDTANLPMSNDSISSLTHSSDEETPVEAVTPKDISYAEPIARAASPDSISTDIQENATFPNSLNLALLVQCQLHNAFDQIDAEIESEIAQSRKRMLQTISYVPPLYSH